MESTEYLQHIESNLLFFNKLRYELLAAGYRLFFASEQKEGLTKFNTADQLILSPELLIGSKDRAVQMLGSLFSDLSVKTEHLARINNIELENDKELLEQHISKIQAESQHNDYNDLFASYTDALLGYTIDRSDILNDLIFKAAGINNEVIHTSQLDKRLEFLRPYTDINTALLLDMTLSLKNTMAALMQEGLDEKVIISKCIIEPFEVENQLVGNPDILLNQ